MKKLLSLLLAIVAPPLAAQQVDLRAFNTNDFTTNSGYIRQRTNYGSTLSNYVAAVGFWKTNVNEGGIQYSNGPQVAKIGATDSGGGGQGFVVGRTNNGGVIESYSGYGGTALGYANGANSHISSVGNGALVWGSAQSAGLLETDGDGGFGFGFATGTGSQVYSSGNGSMAGGDAEGGGKVYVNNPQLGAMAFGQAQGAGAEVRAQSSAAVVMGQAFDGAKIFSSGPNLVYGQGQTGGNINADAVNGAFVHGAENLGAAISASADGALVGGMANNTNTVIQGAAIGSLIHGYAEKQSTMQISRGIGGGPQSYGSVLFGASFWGGTMQVKGADGALLGGTASGPWLSASMGSNDFTWGGNVDNEATNAFCFGLNFTNTTGASFNIGWRSNVFQLTADGRLKLTTGLRNIAIGVSALSNITEGATDNIAIGFHSMTNLDSGTGNTAIGSFSLSKAGTDGLSNVAIGPNTLQNLIDGATCIAVGVAAGKFISSASDDIFIGDNTGTSVTNGSGNTAIGNNAFNGIGRDVSQSTTVGAGSLQHDVGGNNAALGYQGGLTLTSGSNNVFIGSQSDTALATVINSTAFGFRAKVGANNTMVFGSNVTRVQFNDGGVVLSSATANASNGYAADTVHFLKPPTNAPANGQVLEATGAAGDSAWADVQGVTIPNTISNATLTLNTVYTNTSGSVWDLIGEAYLVDAVGVSGKSELSIAVDQTGGTSYTLFVLSSKQNTALTVAENYTNHIGFAVSNAAAFYLTNTSSGSGNSAGLVWLQIVTLSDGAAAGVATLGGNNAFTGANTFGGSGAGQVNINDANGNAAIYIGPNGRLILSNATGFTIFTNASLIMSNQSAAKAGSLFISNGLDVTLFKLGSNGPAISAGYLDATNAVRFGVPGNDYAWLLGSNANTYVQHDYPKDVAVNSVMITDGKGAATNATLVNLSVSGTTITGNAGYCLILGAANRALTAGNTYYLGGMFNFTANTSEGLYEVVVPKTGTIKAWSLTMNNQTTDSATEYSTNVIFLNNTTAVGEIDLLHNASNTRGNQTGLSQAVVAGDYLEIRISPRSSWSTTPNAAQYAAVYIE